MRLQHDPFSWWLPVMWDFQHNLQGKNNFFTYKVYLNTIFIWCATSIYPIFLTKNRIFTKNRTFNILFYLGVSTNFKHWAIKNIILKVNVCCGSLILNQLSSRVIHFLVEKCCITSLRFNSILWTLTCTKKSFLAQKFSFYSFFSDLILNSGRMLK